MSALYLIPNLVVQCSNLSCSSLVLLLQGGDFPLDLFEEDVLAHECYTACGVSDWRGLQYHALRTGVFLSNLALELLDAAIEVLELSAEVAHLAFLLQQHLAIQIAVPAHGFQEI